MKFTWRGDEFSRQLKQKRVIDDNIDMQTLADDLEMNKSTISRCEHGKLPSLESYAKLCKYIGQPLDAFLKLNAREAKKNKK